MIAFLLDVAYLVALLVASPWLVWRAIRQGKYRTGLWQKVTGAVAPRESARPCVWFHAVSVGEVLLLRRVVELLAERRPDVEIVISTTTNTGMEVARQHFARHALFYFPLDFSWATRRAIRRVRPDVVALAELELWPNFIAAAHAARARVALINGRMSPRSHRGYRRLRAVMRPVLRQIDALAVQTERYAGRFVDIGAPADRLHVTGSVKFDGLETDRNNGRTAALRRALRLADTDLVWVAGSTSAPEEQYVLDTYAKLRSTHPTLRLVLVPRHKERFDEVANLIAARGFPLLRRSRMGQVEVPAAGGRAVILVDTLGELSVVWGLADVAFVGGSFAPRGGQNMIEPAGYGAAVTFGPGVWNFQETADQLLEVGGAVQVQTRDELSVAIDRLAGDATLRARLGRAAASFVAGQQGAAERTVELLDRLLPHRPVNALAA